MDYPVTRRHRLIWAMLETIASSVAPVRRKSTRDYLPSGKRSDSATPAGWTAYRVSVEELMALDKLRKRAEGPASHVGYLYAGEANDTHCTILIKDERNG